jgi:CHAD domain-containing protein
LRSLTLRLQVGLGHRLTEEPADSAAARAFKRWAKEGKKLRKALEPVRNADVYLAKLEGLRNSRKGTREGEPQLSPRCLREIEKLEKRLKGQRQKGIDRLRSFLDERGKRLNRLSKEMETAMAPRSLSEARSAAQAALDIFSGLTRERSDLDASNLHEFRKGLKQALYLAESSVAADPRAARLAAAFRRIHLAAGEWHDWQALAQEAARVLPGHGKRDGLVPQLELLASRALRTALGHRRHSVMRFVKDATKIQSSPLRKPVASDPGLVPIAKPMPLKTSA